VQEPFDEVNEGAPFLLRARAGKGEQEVEGKDTGNLVLVLLRHGKLCGFS
jgi:hypothetical protein